ncbi:MAG: helix-turn-helix domain-containing protein [Bacteroidota bacterium]
MFLDTLLVRDLQVIEQAIALIEAREGKIRIAELGRSRRALRNHFRQYIGCAPKEFIQLVRLRKSVYQMKATPDFLTDITYKSNYFDQANFIKSLKSITGKAPKALRKELHYFRFLQF